MLNKYHNVWFVWSKTSYSGDKWICYQYGQTDGQTNQQQANIELDRVNCARLRRPYGGLGGSVKVMDEKSVRKYLACIA